MCGNFGFIELVKRRSMKCIVLRDLRRVQLRDPFRFGVRDLGGPFRSSSDLEVPPDLQIDVETIDAKGRSDLVRDPQVVAVAETMPTRLIEPLGIGSANTGGDSW